MVVFASIHSRCVCALISCLTKYERTILTQLPYCDEEALFVQVQSRVTVVPLVRPSQLKAGCDAMLCLL